MNSENKLSVFGSKGFIGSRFTDLYPDDVIEIEREECKAKSSNILYFISTIDNYNIHNDLHIDIETNLTKLMKFIEANKKEDLVINF